MPKPNILYIFTDQMRASAMGCMHDEAVHTPHLDRLAAQGVLFTNAVANTPVCTPSRA
jgi:arylsulfatase A-like enzyme